ncbi:MAG: hypothetical protein JWM80_1090, partial [Cyanobacteria bacterium RYN_339]|nr:hypothetical protein [Cyanobacteria bacterium RYN_339]
MQDPEGGIPFLALHAPDAWLIQGTEARQRSAIAPAAFAEAFRAAGRREGLATFGPGAAVAWSPSPDGREGVARFATDAAGLQVALGVRQDEDGWRVVWSGMPPAEEEVAFELGRAQMLAEFPHLHNAALPSVRSWLDVTFWRLVGMT